MDETAAAANQETTQHRNFFNLEFFRDTWVGRLKILELLFTLLAAALVPTTVHDHEAGFGFMSFVAWIAFLSTLVDSFLHLIRDIWERLTLLRDFPEIYLCLCLTGVFAFCLGSIVELAIAGYASNPNMARASGLFGFICMLAFAVEAFMHFQSFKQKADERRDRQERSETHQPDEVFTDIRSEA